MKLIAEKRSKHDKYDQLRYLRDDGSETGTIMPRQGILPHDLVHYVVESNLALQHGFTNLVARGADASFTMEMTHDKTNVSVGTEAIQIEAIVEALQAQLWSGVFDQEAFLEGVRGACAARDKPVYQFTQCNPQILFDQAVELNQRWQATGHFQKLELDFAPRKAD